MHSKRDNYELVNNREEYYKRASLKSMSQTVPSLIQIEASLKIYGISGFTPGDLIRISYLPESYYNSVYFQVIKVSHDVGENWSTSLTTKMKINPMDNLQVKSVNIKKSYLQNISGGGLNRIERCLYWLYDITPVKIQKNNEGRLPRNIDFIFHTSIARNPVWDFNDEEMTKSFKATTSVQKVLFLSLIDSKKRGDEDDYKSAVEALQSFINEKTTNPRVKAIVEWQNLTDNILGISISNRTSTCKIGIIGINQSLSAEFRHLWIVTSGQNWIMLPFDPSNAWTEIEEVFRLTSSTPVVLQELADEGKILAAAAQNKKDKEIIELSTSGGS